MNGSSVFGKLREFFLSDPLMGAAVAAAMVAMATTPIAFAVLGQSKWFQARRGRTTQTPEFWSIVCGMMLVMGIPAIFTALVVKSQSFDRNRYEFDPNKTWSVLEQGRGYNSVKEADDAVKREMARLTEERKNLVDSVKKLDTAMLALRGVAGTSPQVAQKVPDVLQRLAAVRRSVGVDGPQQLMDFTAPPVEIANPALASAGGPAPAFAPAALPHPAPAPAAAPVGPGLSEAAFKAEIEAVPAPQKAIAAMLPVTALPAGWVAGKSGEKFVETFNADNLFEKIDGRAESFIQYNVKGMAYTYFHPEGDESNEVQVYVFEMSDPLNALGKYGSEKPEDGVKPVAVGTEGYSSAGSTLFYAGPYYTQIVSTKDDAKFSEFALQIAKRIADKQRPVGPVAGASGEAPATPESVFALLPAGSGKSAPKYVKTDVFGYSFLSDVFMAEYSEGKVAWQGFLRPYTTPEEARAVYQKYLDGAKQDGAEVKEVQAEGADKMVIASNIGLVDAFFVKGNAVGGVNGATDAKAAETFARGFVKGLPAKVPVISAGP